MENKKLNVKLVALDLDDTLLTDSRDIAENTVEALRKCVENKIYVVLCSGRAEEGILPYVRKLNIAGSEYGKFLIAINGCSIFDLHSRTQIFSQNVSGKILIHADDEAEKLGLHSEVYAPDTAFYAVEDKWTKLDVDLCHLKGVVVPDYKKFLNKGFPKMLIPGEPEKLVGLQEKLKNDFGSEAVIFTSKPFFLEILPPNCGKGEAIEWLANHIGIGIQECMCFGDSMNDESMIAKCGFGVAMKNGLDYIKNIADYVTDLDNNNGGVGDFLNKYVF